MARRAEKRHPYRYSAAVRDEARRLREAGMNHFSIARKLGVAPGTITDWLGPTGQIGVRPPELHAEAAKLHDAGLKHSAIARRLGINNATVTEWLGPTGRPGRRPDALRAKAARLVAEGVGGRAVCRQLGITSSTLRRWVGRPVPARSPSDWKRLQRKAIKMAQANDKLTFAEIARKLGVSSGAVGRWVGKGPHPRPTKTNPRYLDAVRSEAIRLMEGGLTATEAGRQIGVARSTAENWFEAAVSKGEAKRPLAKRNCADDFEFTWILRDYPTYIAWQKPMAEWAGSKRRNTGTILNAFRRFIVRYLAPLRLPTTPEELLRRASRQLPTFYDVACRDVYHARGYNNIVHEFLQWLLMRDFSERADDGTLIPSPAFYNPVELVSKAGPPMRSESDKDPLPYGYVDQLRQILAQGPTFRDWTWAQQASGRDDGSNAGDWYEVSEAVIDETDPDCVWRLRSFVDTGKPPVLELWSPVRWVCLLIKNILPARTFQVRMLDSGEADTWRYESGNWVPNTGSLREGTERKPMSQGVFRRVRAPTGEVSTVIYFNTNKTADALKSGAEKGHEVAWPEIPSQPLSNQPHYWLEKMRNWQEKYNPIVQRTAWTTIAHPYRILGLSKSEVQLSMYPDTCFLFRAAEDKNTGTSHLPISNPQVNRAWHKLLSELEGRIAREGTTHCDGSQIRLVKPGPNITTYFPLHSLRVSLITELATAGGMRIELLAKLVGHSRPVMTLYYTKPGHTHIKDAVADACARLDAAKDKSITAWLANAEHDALVARVVSNSIEDFLALLPEHPAARNAVGWMPMHHGLCLAGGNNASELEPNYALRGCHNGGPLIPGKGTSAYAPVPGGARNCVRCRWFVTEPHYMPALTAHLKNLFYHLCEARTKAVNHEETLETLKNEKYDAEKSGVPFAKMGDLNRTQRLLESSMATFVNLAKDVIACHQLIERCNALPTGTGRASTALIATGDVLEAHCIIEETDSELLQLSGVCQDVELYPDLDSGKAVIRQSQILDSALMREGAAPIFVVLSEEEQLRFGNAFMRKLAQHADPTNDVLGFRKVCGVIESGKTLAAAFGISVRELLPSLAEPEDVSDTIRGKKGGG